MADTKEVKAGEVPAALPAVGEASTGYVSPDLSFSDGAGVLPPEEQEWNEARDTATEEDTERVEEAEKEAAEAKAKEQEEEAAKDAESRKARVEHEEAVQGAISNTPTGKAAAKTAK